MKMRFIFLIVIMAFAEEEEEQLGLTTAELDAESTAEYEERLGIKEEKVIDFRPRDYRGWVILNLTQEEEDEVDKLKIPMERGMDTARRVFIGVCWWVYVKLDRAKTRHDYTNCRTDADVMLRNIVMQNRHEYVIGEYLKTKDPEEWASLEKEFGKRCVFRIGLPPCYLTLPQEMQRNCTDYLSYSRKKYEVDESEAIGVEKGADYPYLGFAHCLIHMLRLTHGDKAVETVRRDMRLFRTPSPWLAPGVYWKKPFRVYTKPYMVKLLAKPSELLIHSHIMVCWYEYLIASYEPEHYKNCKIKQKQIQMYLLFRLTDGSDNIVMPEFFDEKFRISTHGHGIKTLPKVYQDECAKYLIEHPLDDPPADESVALGVGSETLFPFRSYDYCLLHTLRTTRGDQAIDTIKSKMPEINRPVDPRSFKNSLLKVARAQYLVCWYEFARREGKIGHHAYEKCKGKRSLYDFQEWNTKLYHQNQEMWEIMFGHELMQHNMHMLPSYRKECGKYISFYTEHFAAGESDLLDDDKVEYSLKSYTHCILHHLREINGEEAIQLVKKQISRSDNPDDYLETLMGIEMVTIVNTVIGYHDLSKKLADVLSDKSERVKDKFIESHDDKDFPEYKEVEFATEVRNEIHLLIPATYHDCKMYLTVPEQVFPADESDALGDEGIEYLFKSYCHCISNTLRKKKGNDAIEILVSKLPYLNPSFRSVLSSTLFKNNASGVDSVIVTNEDIDAAILTLERGHKLICWYEFAKSLFDANQQKFHVCNNAPSQLKVISLASKYMEKFADMKGVLFGKLMKTILLKTLPAWYAEKCGPMLEDPNYKPTSDETEVLNDEGSDYIYKAYAHCVVHGLRDKHGDKAIKDVKMKATNPVKDWHAIIHERLNIARNWKNTRLPLIVPDELNEGAQKHADEMASNCVLEKSNPEARIAKNGSQGESVAWNTFEPEEAVLFAVSEIWEEGKLFDPNIRYTSQEDQWAQGGIGRYGQMMWKKTTHVGFGLAINRTCEADPINHPGTYIVIRYFPRGNRRNRFRSVQVPPGTIEYWDY